MPYKLSRCIALKTSQWPEAVRFYEETLGLKVVDRYQNGAELSAEQSRFFVDGGPGSGIILEFIVPDLEIARHELELAGCKVIRWEGKKQDCFIRDPFGLIFNLWEDPEAFK
jgi:predicted enzyme related to lactoylglutathione lyase